MAKTKQTKAESAPSTVIGKITVLPLDLISESEFSTQWHRRRRFRDEELEELANSIKNQGLINPITVRPRKWEVIKSPSHERFDLYLAETDTRRVCGGMTRELVEACAAELSHEIVAGERRFLAAKLAGLDAIPCFVKELTDEQALEIQMQENLQRVDVHPLDEAFSYKFLIEEKRMTAADLQIKFGKTEKYIALRLKLNNLIPEALELVSSERLPLGHAVEVAKFDADVQPEVLKRCFDTSWGKGGWEPDTTKPLPLRKVLEKVSAEVLLDLSRARFDKKDKRLRPDGLTCPKCPERTGARNSLFEEFYEASGKSDRCLNPACFQLKTDRFIQITRDEATRKIKAENETASDYRAAIAVWVDNERADVERIFPGEPVRVEDSREFRDVTDDRCESAFPAVYLGKSNKFGAVAWFCANTRCKKHLRSNPGGGRNESPAQSEARERREKARRKQEIFDCNVSEGFPITNSSREQGVRFQVFEQAGRMFAVQSKEDLGAALIINYDDFLDHLARFYQLLFSHDETTGNFIKAILKKWYAEEDAPGSRWMANDDLKNLRRYIFEADDATGIEDVGRWFSLGLYFLLMHAHKGKIWQTEWKDQTEVVEIAGRFGINYKRLDAGYRLAKSPKKYFAQAQDYSGAVERGDAVERPVFYKPEGE